MRPRKEKPEIIIFYECPCNENKKISHHPNYDKPFWVVKLCNLCHKREHIRIGTLYGDKALKAKGIIRKKNGLYY